MPPEQENKPLVWPYWPIKLRSEREFAIATKEFIGERAKAPLKTVRVSGRTAAR